MASPNLKPLLVLAAATAAWIMASGASAQVAPEAIQWGEPVDGVQLGLALAATGPPTLQGELPALELQIRNRGSTAVTVNPEALAYANVEIDDVWYMLSFGASASRLPLVIAPGSQGNALRIFQRLDSLYEVNSRPPRQPELRPGPHRIRLRNLNLGDSLNVRTADGKALVLVSNRIVIDIPEMPGTAKPAAQPGLAIRMESLKAAVRPGDSVALRLTFRNESANAFRLPHTVNPPTYQLWVLKLRNTNTGKTFTGVSALPMGAAPGAGSIQPQLLAPGAAITASVSFDSFVFLEGDLGFEEARNIYFPQRLKPRSEFALPGGAYAVRVIVRFPGYPDRPNLPADVQAAAAAIGNDPVPLWKGSEARSDETQILVQSGGSP